MEYPYTTDVKPPEILVADDNPASLQLLTNILVGKGYRVRPAPDGRMALRSISARLPDLILLDINMPEIDGYEVCRRIKADHVSRNIPVIFISALTDATQKVEGFQAGGVDYITKPFDNDEVLARVNTHLTIHHMQRQMVEQNVKLEQEVKERKHAESLLQKAQSDLETRVADRTRELRQINRQLASEIDERRRSEQENLRQTRELALLNQVIAASVSETKPEAILNIVCKELSEAFKAPQSMAALLDKESVRMTFVAEYINDGKCTRSVINHAIVLDEHSDFLKMLGQKEVVWVEDIQHDRRLNTIADLLIGRRTCSVLIAPIINQHEAVGWLFIETFEPRSFSLSQIRLCRSVADQVSSVLTRIWLDEERRKLEDQYNQAQKMEALGKLTGGVAHDFNNILTVIMGVTDLMGLQQSQTSPLLPKLNQIHEAASRAADLVRQLLAFSRQQVLQPTVLNLNEVVENFEKMMRLGVGEEIEMATVLDPNLGHVKADSGQIEQVLMNLVVNARDAMPGGGKLTIETANKYLDDTYVRKHMGITPGNYIMVAISDTGVGMDAHTRKHIFEPFFTTKPKGEGTGLGLATVHGIINQSGGHIWVYSEPGMGTCFKIYLQQIEEAVEAQASARIPDKTAGGSETILVVEDDDIVRTLVTETLTSFGYTILQADCAYAADEILSLHDGDIEMLLTDVVLPGGESGSQMAERLLNKLPDLKVLFMSGYTDNAIVHHGVLDADVAFIQKPFMPADLARKVRQIMDNPA